MGGQAYRWQTQQSGTNTLGPNRAEPGRAGPKLGEAGVSGGQPVKQEVCGGGDWGHYRSNAPSTLP